MKLTKQTLQKIIKEEIQNILQEQGEEAKVGATGTSSTSDVKKAAMGAAGELQGSAATGKEQEIIKLMISELGKAAKDKYDFSTDGVVLKLLNMLVKHFGKKKTGA